MDRSQKQFAWWYYFWLLVALTAVSLLFWPVGPADWVLFGFESLALLGLWAYLRRRPLLSVQLWRLYFLVILAAFVYSAIRLITGEHSDPFGDGSWYKWIVGIWLLSFALLTPLFIALWRYAFNSPDIWQNDASAP
jgi:hypothetical protein